MKEHTVKYHHGGRLLRGNEVKYMDGETTEFAVDPDRLCYWDLLVDLKELGYDVEKSLNLFFLDDGGALKTVKTDEGIIDLVAQLMRHQVIDIYVECSNGETSEKLPDSLLPCPIVDDISIPCSKNLVDISLQCPGDDVAFRVNENAMSEHDISSREEYEETLVDVPIVGSDTDDERDQARVKVTRYMEMKKAVQGNAGDNPVRVFDNAGSDNASSDNVGLEQAKKGKVAGFESDYIDSSDPGSYEQTSEDSDADDAIRHRTTSQYYNPNVPLPEFFLDLKFTELKQFKSALVDFSTRNGFEFKYIKNDKVRVRARCSAKECTWMILCSWCNAKRVYVVKHYVAQHSCLLQTTKNKRVTANVVANRFGDLISSMPFIKPINLKAMVRRELGVFVSTKVCRNAKGLVLKKIEQQFREDFLVINSYGMELRQSNPGSTVVIISEKRSADELPIFQKMYICLFAVKKGFIDGCRRLIGLDGCFLKGLMKGQLLVAVGRDGNNQMFPIAWAVVDKETSESWSWFIQHLQADLCMGDGLGWAVVSDMQKGLIHAVNKLLPSIEHRMCARHIYARWGKKYQGKELQLHFWNTAKATSVPEVKKYLEIMKNLKGGVRAVEELLEKWPINGWCQAYVSDMVKCENVDNNMCETFNGVLLEARIKPIIGMFEEIRQYVMNRLVVKRDYTMKWNLDCGPNIVAKLEKERKKSVKWKIEWNGGASYEVFWDDVVQHVRHGFVVKLEHQCCSCGKWNKTGIPCEHAMAVIIFCGEDPVSTHLEAGCEWFSKEIYLRAYKFNVNPLRGRMFWPETVEGPLLPLLVKRMPGRPTKKRKREPLEGKNKGSSKLARTGRIMRCKNCNQPGHNRLKCPSRGNTSSSATSPPERPPTSSTAHDGAQQQRGKSIPSTSRENRSTKTTSSRGNQRFVSYSAPFNALSENAPVIILRGAHTGEQIVGRENPEAASFITATQLIARRDKRKTKHGERESSQQTLSVVENPEFTSTQESITKAAR